MFEPLYTQGRSEVNGIFRTGIQRKAMVLTSMERLIPGRAADVLLAMVTVLRKLDITFGDVCPADMTLEQFFTARRMPMELPTGRYIAGWKIWIAETNTPVASHLPCLDPYSGVAYTLREYRMHRHPPSFWWRGSFDVLIRHTWVAEYGPSSTTSQQAINPSADKLDMILKWLSDFISAISLSHTHNTTSYTPSHIQSH